MVLSTRRTIPIPSAGSYTMCVTAKHGLVIIADSGSSQLHMFSLVDGRWVRSSAIDAGSAKDPDSCTCSGLCTSSDGDTVLVAKRYTDCVHEMRIADGLWVRSVGRGVLKQPQCVDCDADAIVVSEDYPQHRISVLSWANGSPRVRFGSYGGGPGKLCGPRGIRLLADGNGLVIADMHNNRLCVFGLHGEFVEAVGNGEQGLSNPIDVLQCASDRAFIVAARGNSMLFEIRNGARARVYGKHGIGDDELNNPIVLAALPNDGGFVLDYGNRRVQQLIDCRARLSWIRGCVFAHDG